MNKLQNHLFIVFCGDNMNTLGLIRSLGEKGLNPIIVNYSINPYLINHSIYSGYFYQVDSPEAGLDMIVRLWGKEQEKPFIFTMDDYTAILLDQHYDELVEHFYFFHSGKQGVLTYFMNKKNTCDLAEKCGIPQPKGEVLKKGKLPKSLRYPVITKVTMSIKGAWKNDVYICQSEEELKEAYNLIKADELLVQEYIEKKNELCIDGISLNGGEDIILSYTSEYLRMGKGNFGHYMMMKPYENEDVCKKIKNIIKGSHYTGIFDLECLIDSNNNLWFLEVNFRNSMWSYAHTYGGMNLPYYWAKWTLEGKINSDELSIRKEPFTAMGEIADFVFVLNDPNTSLWTWFKQFRSCECPYIYNKMDPKPFYYAIWNKCKTTLRHKFLKQ